MLYECKLSKSVIDRMKSGSMPSADKLATIAKYLDVSTDFLLGNDNIKEGHFLLSEEEQLIQDYRKLTEQGQEYIRQTMVMAVISYKKDDFVSNLETS